MPTDVLIPEWIERFDGRIVKWLKKDGEPLATLETEKTVIDIPSPSSYLD